MKILLVTTILLASPWALAGGSGIGNGTYLGSQVSTVLPAAVKLDLKGDTLYDGTKNEALLQIGRISKAKALAKWGAQLVPAKLGLVTGYEYSPRPGDPAAEQFNFWLVCGEKDTDCMLLTPRSRTNHYVLSVIGALQPAAAIKSAARSR